MSADSAHPNGTDTIVLIHGLWVTALSWEHWISRYRARGYRVLAPNWPGIDARIEELRRNPSAIAGLGVTEITGHYDDLIRELHPPPVIIEHSLGGLVAQILLDRGLGAAGVAIDPAPAKGVMKLALSMLRVEFPALRNPANHHKAVTLTPRRFHYAFTTHLISKAPPRYMSATTSPAPAGPSTR